MSKFVGKFRLKENYSDDYAALKSIKQKTGHRNEHGEIKKLKTRTLREDMTEGYDYHDLYEDKFGTYN